MALEQRRDALTVAVAYRDVQQQVTIPERLVVAEPLQGSHHPRSQPVIAASLIQDACSLLTAQALHRGGVDPGRFQIGGDGGVYDLSVSRPTTSPVGR